MSLVDERLVKRARRDVDAFTRAMENCANKRLGASAEVVVIAERLFEKTPIAAMLMAIAEGGSDAQEE